LHALARRTGPLKIVVDILKVSRLFVIMFLSQRMGTGAEMIRLACDAAVISL